ncbi:MAG: pyridoxal phosphate-dependent aminotransferase [Chitinophagales bacterium]
MQTAKRLEGIGEYYFSQKLREIDSLRKEGKNIINLGIGSPDLPPNEEVIRVLQEECAKPNVHAYQGYKGAGILRNAMASWYKKWYGVNLDPETEILPLIGSKEGIMHICMTYVNEGDAVWVPNPGYPTYRSAAKLAGGSLLEYDLHEENHWFPDFERLGKIMKSSDQKSSVTKKRNLFFVNYPHMPTGQLPNRKFFEELVAFAKNHDLLLVHDNPYSFILNDHPLSLLSIEGSKEVTVELNSLSKSQNMAGWRVGLMAGAKEKVDEVLRFKSNMDSGMFLPIQLAAAKALDLPSSWYDDLNAIYRKRRERVFELLSKLNCQFSREQAGLFIWARIPSGYEDGYDLSDQLLYQANVFITPGGIFGPAGDQFIRVSLCCAEEKLEESIGKINSFQQNKKHHHV